MRTAFIGTDFIQDDAGAIVGVALGYDHCAEHETGIQQIQQALGVEGALGVKPGLDRYRIQSAGHLTALTLEGGGWGFGLLQEWGRERTIAGLRRPYGDRPLSAEWDQREFVVIGWTADSISALQKLHAAILAGHGTLSMSGRGNPFGGSGPCLCDTSINPTVWAALHDKLVREQEEANQWAREWRKETTGLFRELYEMGEAVSELCGNDWHGALPMMYLPLHTEGYRHFRDGWYNHPKHAIDYGGEKRVWLNPNRQDLWPAGWFSSAELRAWARGHGRIWGLCATLPGTKHPFWAWVKESIPKPNQNATEWPEKWPWSGIEKKGDIEAPIYLDGYHFWHHAEKKFGFHVNESGYRNPTNHELFREDRDDAAEKGLTVSVRVSDEDLFRETVRTWNEGNPDHRFEPTFYGRGPELEERLEAAKKKLRKRRGEE